MLAFALSIVLCSAHQGSGLRYVISPRWGWGGVGAIASASDLQQRLAALAVGFPGRVGIAVQEGSTVSGVKASAAFPLQSVCKMVLAAAVLDKVDRHLLKLDGKLYIRRANLSVGHQPLAALVTVKGYTTDLADIIRRAIMDSDNAACDILFVKAGSAEGMAKYLKAKGLDGIRIDRKERDVQTQILGIRFEPSFVDEKAFDKAIAAISKARRDAAWKSYLSDPRDTATPAGMCKFLGALSSGKLLSPASTKVLLDAMRTTQSGNERLKAGLAPGWTLAHKSGTSGRWAGSAAAFNDVGSLASPDGKTISVAVFISGTTASDDKCAALMAAVTKAVTESK